MKCIQESEPPHVKSDAHSQGDREVPEKKTRPVAQFHALRHRFSRLNSFPVKMGSWRTPGSPRPLRAAGLSSPSRCTGSRAWLLRVEDAIRLHMPSEETVTEVLWSFLPTLKYSSSLFFCRLFHIPGPLLSLIYINLFYQTPFTSWEPCYIGGVLTFIHPEAVSFSMISLWR